MTAGIRPCPRGSPCPWPEHLQPRPGLGVWHCPDPSWWPPSPWNGLPGHSGAAWDPVFSLRRRNLVRPHSHLHASCSPGLGAADTQAGPSAAPEPTVDRSPPFSGPYCPYLQNERPEDQGREKFVHSVGVRSLTLPVGLSVCRGHETLTSKPTPTLRSLLVWWCWCREEAHASLDLDHSRRLPGGGGSSVNLDGGEAAKGTRGPGAGQPRLRFICCAQKEPGLPRWFSW